jgi:hypothetical protein
MGLQLRQRSLLIAHLQKFSDLLFSKIKTTKKLNYTWWSRNNLIILCWLIISSLVKIEKNCQFFLTLCSFNKFNFRRLIYLFVHFRIKSEKLTIKNKQINEKLHKSYIFKTYFIKIWKLYPYFFITYKLPQPLIIPLIIPMKFHLD